MCDRALSTLVSPDRELCLQPFGFSPVEGTARPCRNRVAEPSAVRLAGIPPSFSKVSGQFRGAIHRSVTVKLCHRIPAGGLRLDGCRLPRVGGASAIRGTPTRLGRSRTGPIATYFRTDLPAYRTPPRSRPYSLFTPQSPFSLRWPLGTTERNHVNMGL